VSGAGACLITFASGAVVEGVCAKWVQAVGAKRAVKAGLMSGVWAVALLTGLDEALHKGWPAATWVLGYMVGSYLAVRLS
jgi:hypothetical protein